MNVADINKYDHYYGDVKLQAQRLEIQRHWSTTKGTEENIGRLLRYVGNAKNDYWRLVRIWRVRYLVNGVYMNTQNDLVRKRIRKLMTALDREKAKVLSRRGWGENHTWRKWDWAKSREQAVELLRENPGLFQTLRRNIEGKAYQPNGAIIGFDVTRMHTNHSLAHLVRLLRDVEFEENK